MVDRCFSNMLCKGRSRSETVFPLLIYSPNVCSSKAVKYATYSVLKKRKNSSPVYYYKNTHPSSNETGNEKFILQSSLLIGSPHSPPVKPIDIGDLSVQMTGAQARDTGWRLMMPTGCLRFRGSTGHLPVTAVLGRSPVSSSPRLL